MARRRTPSIMNFHTETGIVLKGDQGYSAYEIAVQNGFIGTEAEWLESLKGNATKAEQYAKEAGSYREEVKRSAIDAGNSAKLASDTVKNIGTLQRTLESATIEAVRKLSTATDEANKVERLTRSEAAAAELSRKQADIDARETKRLQELVRRDKDISTTATEVTRMLESRTRVAALNSTLQLLNIVYAYNKLGKNVISVGMGVHPIHITIPTKGWVKEKTGEYDYYLDIPHDTITAALTPQLIFKPDDIIRTVNVGISPACETLDKKLRIYQNRA